MFINKAMKPHYTKHSWKRAINFHYDKNKIEYSFLKLLRLLFYHVPLYWSVPKFRYLKQLITFKTKLKPKQFTLQQTKWLMILSFTMAIASISINHLTDYKWLYWVCLSILWAVPAYIWFEPCVKAKLNQFRSRKKFDAFEEQVGQPPKSLYNGKNEQ